MEINYGHGYVIIAHVKGIKWLHLLQAIKSHLLHPRQDNCSATTNRESLEPPTMKVRLLDFCSVSDDSVPMKSMVVEMELQTYFDQPCLSMINSLIA